MPLPRQQAGESYPGDRPELTGVLDVSDFGCFNLALDDEHILVIWPAGWSVEVIRLAPCLSAANHPGRSSATLP
jgi:hypothetical protein